MCTCVPTADSSVGDVPLEASALLLSSRFTQTTSLVRSTTAHSKTEEALPLLTRVGRATWQCAPLTVGYAWPPSKLYGLHKCQITASVFQNGALCYFLLPHCSLCTTLSAD